MDAAPASDEGSVKGRILRLKQGYNPNSSSIGTIVFTMPAALLGATVAFGLAAGIICSVFMGGEARRHPGDGTEPDEPDEPDGEEEEDGSPAEQVSKDVAG